ncbi:MAG TPA: zinc-binding dehydrogenase [Candidatus Bathyarchaeia archaeon]|nr:zinc-binding dehydrogenase [Candidatus Bathyarchaeia archaeon]
MRAVRAHARGGAEPLPLDDVPKPQPGAGEAVSGVDVVLDPIGGRTTEASVGVRNDGGSVISLAGPPTVTLPEGRDLGARFFIAEPERSHLIELARLVDEGRLRVEVAETFSLEDAAAAYEYGRTARRRGKVVIQVTEAVPKPVELAVDATAG